MWKQIKISFFENIIVPIVNFWDWLYNKTSSDSKKALEWPYHDKVVDEEGTEKLVYLSNETGLESRLSRKFKVRDE